MSNPTPYRNPMALLALVVSLVPSLTGLALLGLRYGVGPQVLLGWLALLSGPVMLALIVAGSALNLIAGMRTEGRRDWRVPTAWLLWLLAVGSLALFFFTAP